MHYTCLVIGEDIEKCLAPFNSCSAGKNASSGKYDWYKETGEWCQVLLLKDTIHNSHLVKTGNSQTSLFPIPGSLCISASKCDIDWINTLANEGKPFAALILNGIFYAKWDMDEQIRWKNFLMAQIETLADDSICTAVDCHCWQ